MSARKKKRLMVVINPAAGKAEPVLSVLNDVFGPADLDWDVAITHEAGDGEAAARQAAKDGYDFIGAYGGDGSVAEVASALADGGPPMLLLPGGTGNALADDLGIPFDLRQAASLLTEPHKIERIDLGRSADRYFALRLTMGLEAAMVDAATPELKGRYGWLAYAFAGLQALSDAPVARYKMTIDGEDFESEGLALLVANSSSTGVAGVRLANNVSVADGVLDVVVVQRGDLGGLLGSAADAAQGLEPRSLGHWSGRQVHIEADPPQRVLRDGEEAGMTPLDAEVVPRAVRVIVPKAAASGR